MIAWLLANYSWLATIMLAGLVFALGAWLYGYARGVQKEKRKLERQYRETRERADAQDYISDDDDDTIRERLRARGERSGRVQRDRERD